MFTLCKTGKKPSVRRLRLIKLYKHLLPTGAPWSLVADSWLRKFFIGLSGFIVDVVLHADLLILDLFPSTTRELGRHEEQFGLQSSGLTDTQRRARVAGAWAALGGQSAAYIEDILRTAGFFVYVHEAWAPGVGTWGVYRCGEQRAYCGSPNMVCAASSILRNPTGVLSATNASIMPGMGYPLVNKTPAMQYAETPGLASAFPFILYIGGEVFGTLADIPDSRRDEFEQLCLKLKPAHLWLGMLINYT